MLVDTVPSAMAELLRLGRLPASIRTVNLGGEPLKGSLVRGDLRQLPDVERVVNLYGPSEDTTFTSFSVVPAAPGTRDRPAADGRGGLRARRRDAAGAAGRSGRALHGWRRGDPRLPGAPGPDGGALHPQSLRARRARGSTRWATWCATCRRASSTSWAGSTTR